MSSPTSNGCSGSTPAVRLRSRERPLSAHPARPVEGRLTERRAGVQPPRRQGVFMPRTRRWGHHTICTKLQNCTLSRTDCFRPVTGRFERAKDGGMIFPHDRLGGWIMLADRYTGCPPRSVAAVANRLRCVGRKATTYSTSVLGSPYPTPAAVAIQERLALASDRKHRAAASGMGSKS
jgi:hypothetical protein